MPLNNNATLREDFRHKMEGSGKVRYGDSAINKAFLILRDKDLLMQGIGRGNYYVNPKYFTRKSEFNRVEHLKFILELSYHKKRAKLLIEI